MAELHRKYPDIPLWMTEVCYAYEAGTPKSMSLHATISRTETFGVLKSSNDLEAHASAWIYWNMILDEKGGPWSVSYVHGNPDPNISTLLLLLIARKEVMYTGLYYYLTHFSKFRAAGGGPRADAGIARRHGGSWRSNGRMAGW